MTEQDNQNKGHRRRYSSRPKSNQGDQSTRLTGKTRRKYRNHQQPKTALQRRLPPAQIHAGKIGAPNGDAENGDTLKIIPLGGMGEIGKNMYAFEYKDDIVVVDAGMMFPEDDMPGIDFLIPNTEYLQERHKNIRGLVFTHGHMDHIGGYPYVQERLGNPDIYTSELTRGILIKRHSEFPHLPKPVVHLMKPGDKEKMGDYFKVEFVHMNHSVPGTYGLFIETPKGNIFFSTDFKIDPNPLNENPVTPEELKAIGDRDIQILMCDSTDSEKPGHSISESQITKDMDVIFHNATGMLIVGTFSSMINRMQQLIALSEKYGRKVVFDGYSLKTNVEIAKELGYIKMQKGTQISMDQLDDFPRDKITVIATGAQGEEKAALMRIVNQEHRFIRLQRKDSVVFSSSVIPGNERSIQRLKDMLYRAGVNVFHYNMMDIHAGGHGRQEDLKILIEAMRPKFMFPMHGHYSMLVTLGKLAQEKGVPEENIIIADNGSIVHFTKDQWWFDKKTAPSSYVMVDGLGVGDIGNVVLRDRQMLAADGMFIVFVLIDSKTGKVYRSPEIISRGFVYLRENKELLLDVRKRIRFIVERKAPKPLNEAYLKEALREEIGQFLFQKTERRPMVIPVVNEV